MNTAFVRRSDSSTAMNCDMMSAGIVDPTKVTRSALQNAASIASVILTTESVVADKKDPAAEAAGQVCPDSDSGDGSDFAAGAEPWAHQLWVLPSWALPF